MDLITADMEHLTASTDAFHFASVPYAEPDPASPHDSIASLMQLAEKMDSLLPLDCPITRKPLSDVLLPPSPVPRPPTKTLPPALKLEPDMYTRTDDPSGRIFLSGVCAAPAPPALLSPTGPPAALSPCSVREMPSTPSPRAASTPLRRARVAKPVRKPKTYSKPVASRFCHICSRTPRRGHGAAVCARMRDGLCRKIVCEQCIREQGWAFDRIRANPEAWQCPHCADACPPRSQCHIYNRINARRKRVTPVTAQSQAPTPPPAPGAAALATAPNPAAAPAAQTLGDGVTPVPDQAGQALYSWP